MLQHLLTLLQGVWLHHTHRGLVFNQSRLAIISPPLIKLHGLSLAARITFKSLMLAHKGRAGSAPSDSNNPVPAHAAPRPPGPLSAVRQNRLSRRGKLDRCGPHGSSKPFSSSPAAPRQAQNINQFLAIVLMFGLFSPSFLPPLCC